MLELLSLSVFGIAGGAVGLVGILLRNRILMLCGAVIAMLFSMNGAKISAGPFTWRLIFTMTSYAAAYPLRIFWQIETITGFLSCAIVIFSLLSICSVIDSYMRNRKKKTEVGKPDTDSSDS